MRALVDALVDRALAFEPTARAMALTRSLLALAEIVSVATTPDGRLFTATPGLPDGMRCGGAGAFSLWCIDGSGTAGLYVSRAVTLAVLFVVTAGYRPQWTCVPQWYVTFSLTTSVTQPFGGDNAALIATTLLIPIAWGDRRTWQWSSPGEPLAPAWRGAAYVAWWALRAQITVIYLDAALSKLADPAWRHGTALASVLTDPNYGLPYPLRGATAPLLASSALVAAMTWGVLVVESGVAVSALAGRRVRRMGVVLAVALHGGIIFAMGLVTFGITMVGIVVVLWPDDRGKPRKPEPPRHAVPSAAQPALQEEEVP